MTICPTLFRCLRVRDTAFVGMLSLNCFLLGGTASAGAHKAKEVSGVRRDLSWYVADSTFLHFLICLLQMQSVISAIYKLIFLSLWTMLSALTMLSCLLLHAAGFHRCSVKIWFVRWSPAGHSDLEVLFPCTTYPDSRHFRAKVYCPLLQIVALCMSPASCWPWCLKSRKSITQRHLIAAYNSCLATWFRLQTFLPIWWEGSCKSVIKIGEHFLESKSMMGY